MSEEQTLTYGQKAVGLTFNPSGDPRVNDVKMAYAEIIDALNGLRSTSHSAEARRHYSIAITDTETAQMRAVKAITWRY